MLIRTLIIDDEDKIRKVYQKVFDILGIAEFCIHEASDAVQATNILIRQPIQLVLLDLRMPGVNGRQMYEVIREYDPDMKIIVASVLPVSIQKKLVPDADGYFDKSEGPYQLLHRLAQFFEKTNIQEGRLQ